MKKIHYVMALCLLSASARAAGFSGLPVQGAFLPLTGGTLTGPTTGQAGLYLAPAVSSTTPPQIGVSSWPDGMGQMLFNFFGRTDVYGERTGLQLLANDFENPSPAQIQLGKSIIEYSDQGQNGIVDIEGFGTNFMNVAMNDINPGDGGALNLITQSGPISANSGADLDMTAVGSIKLDAGSGAGSGVGLDMTAVGSINLTAGSVAGSGADLDMTAVGSINLAAGSGAGNAVYVSFPSILNVGISLTTVTCTSAISCSISCPAGTYIISGGCSCVGCSIGFDALMTNEPDSDTSWQCGLSVAYGVLSTIRATAICGRIH